MSVRIWKSDFSRKLFLGRAWKSHGRRTCSILFWTTRELNVLLLPRSCSSSFGSFPMEVSSIPCWFTSFWLVTSELQRIDRIDHNSLRRCGVRWWRRKSHEFAYAQYHFSRMPKTSTWSDDNFYNPNSSLLPMIFSPNIGWDYNSKWLIRNRRRRRSQSYETVNEASVTLSNCLKRHNKEMSLLEFYVFSECIVDTRYTLWLGERCPSLNSIGIAQPGTAHHLWRGHTPQLDLYNPW
jgi:hypothetical protein